jgi:Ca2+-binding RTX toxin-like protein
MLRNLVSLFVRPSKSKLRRSRRGNGLRSSLSVENLEERMVLSATLPNLQMSPETVATTGQFVSLNYLARYTDVVDSIVPNEFGGFSAVLSNYSYSIDWGDDSTPDADVTFPSVPIQDVVGAQIDGKIKGRHTYAEAGEYTVTVSLTESDDVETTVVTGQFTIVVADPFVPEPGDQQFQFDNVFGNVPEGSSVSTSFKIPESVDPNDIAGWTVSWGDQTVHYNGNPSSISHIYADFYEQFNLDNLDNHVGNVYYISALVHLNAGGSGDATYEAGTYGASAAFYADLFDQAPTVSVDGDATVGKDASYTLNLNYDGDVPADRPVIWRILWDTDDPAPVFENFVGDPSTASHVYTEAGTYNILAITTNDDNSTYFGVWSVTVEDKPVADAGGPYTALIDTPIMLTGVGTNGVGLTYAWDLDGDDVFGEVGEVGDVVTFDPSGVAGTRTVKLKVTDENGIESDVDEATINVLATGSLVIDDTLHVVGSSTGGDTVQVSVSGGNLVVNTGSGPQTFSLSDVDELSIRTGGGNDVINIGAAVAVPTTVDAGDGNDLIIGGSGRSVLMGGSGADIVYGGAGDDVLLGGTGNDLVLGGGGNDGGAGRDLIVGGVGSDALLGGGGEDILIGGYTIHDGDIAKLDEIMGIWSSSASFNDRIALLTAVGGLLQANQAVFDDDSLDVISGGGGADLVFGDRSLLGDGAIDLIALQTAQDRLIALN